MWFGHFRRKYVKLTFSYRNVLVRLKNKLNSGIIIEIHQK